MVDFRTPGVFGPTVNPGSGVNWNVRFGSGTPEDRYGSGYGNLGQVEDYRTFLPVNPGYGAEVKPLAVDDLTGDDLHEGIDAIYGTGGASNGGTDDEDGNWWDVFSKIPYGEIFRYGAGPAANLYGSVKAAQIASDAQKRALEEARRWREAEWTLADQTRAERTEPMEAYNALVQDKINRANSRNLAFQTMAGNFMAEHAFPGQDMQFDKYLPPDLPASMQSTAARDRMPYPSQSSSQARQSTPEYSSRYRGLSYEDLGAEQAWQNAQETERKAREHEYGDSFWDPIKSAIGPAATLAGSIMGGPGGVALAMGGGLYDRYKS
jgi:hypothetical protein